MPSAHVFITLLTVLATSTLIQGKEGSECKLSSNPDEARPVVTPYNSSHIKVSWDKVFQGCRQEDAASLNVISGIIITPVKLDQEEVLFRHSPCLEHSVMLVLKYLEPGKR